jgi:hypothetical protein
LLDPITDRYGIAGETMAFKITGRDPEGLALTFSGSGLPAAATLDPASGMFMWTPGTADIGSRSVTFIVTDSGALSDSASARLIVGAPGQQAGPPENCDAMPFTTISDNIGMGLDPGPKDVREHAFFVAPGTQSITGALSWFLPVRDLDFHLLDANHNPVKSSASLSDPEVITLLNPPSGTYYWQVVAFTNPDTSDYEIVSSACVAQSVDVPVLARQVFSLAPGMPNPFRQRTTIGFTLPEGGPVDLRVFDVAGRTVRRLHSGWLPAGAHRAIWDRQTDGGGVAPAGVYFYRLDQGGRSLSSRVILLP